MLPSAPSTNAALEQALAALRTAIEAEADPAKRAEMYNRVGEVIHPVSPISRHPVGRVWMVPIGMVRPNGYNPNSVAKIEMGLLHTSIKHDGYTMPVVTVWNPADQVFEIVDGFHRYHTMLTNKDIWDSTGGLLPIVVIDKPINDRMASTVRHNRARGKHSVQGMGSMVFALLTNGWADDRICNELGMQPEELLRLKHVTGFSALYKDGEYKSSWVTERQVKIAADYKAASAKVGG